MALLSKTGSFPGASTHGGSTTVNGIGFRPKVIFIWAMGGSSSGNQYSLAQRSGWSIVLPEVGSHAAMGNYVSGTVSSPSVTRRMDSQYAINAAGSTTSVWTRRATLTSVNDDGFTIYWNTGSTTATGYTVYLALGGDAIQETAFYWWNMPSSTGNYTVNTGSFRPDLVMTSHVGANSGNPVSSSAAAAYGFGAAAGDSDQWCFTTYRSSSWDTRTFDPSRHITVLNGSSEYQRAAFTGMTATGMNFTTDLTSFGSSMSTVALRGKLRVKVGTFTSPTSTGNVTQSVYGVGFQPSVVIFGGVHDVDRVGSTDVAGMGMGAMDASGNVSGSVVASTTTSRQVAAENYAYIQLLGAGVGQRFSFNSFHSDGFRINWVSSNNENKRIGYIALAEDDRATETFSSQII